MQWGCDGGGCDGDGHCVSRGDAPVREDDITDSALARLMCGLGGDDVLRVRRFRVALAPSLLAVPLHQLLSSVAHALCRVVCARSSEPGCEQNAALGWR